MEPGESTRRTDQTPIHSTRYSLFYLQYLKPDRTDRADTPELESSAGSALADTKDAATYTGCNGALAQGGTSQDGAPANDITLKDGTSRDGTTKNGAVVNDGAPKHSIPKDGADTSLENGSLQPPKNQRPATCVSCPPTNFTALGRKTRSPRFSESSVSSPSASTPVSAMPSNNPSEGNECAYLPATLTTGDAFEFLDPEAHALRRSRPSQPDLGSLSMPNWHLRKLGAQVKGVIGNSTPRFESPQVYQPGLRQWRLQHRYVADDTVLPISQYCRYRRSGTSTPRSPSRRRRNVEEGGRGRRSYSVKRKGAPSPNGCSTVERAARAMEDLGIGSKKQEELLTRFQSRNGSEGLETKPYPRPFMSTTTSPRRSPLRYCNDGTSQEGMPHSPFSASTDSDDEDREEEDVRSISAAISNKVENLIHMDASTLMHSFHVQLEHYRSSLSKANVLVTGTTGSGKSSILNMVFGRRIAETGAGYPVTKHYSKYDIPDKHVTIYDSKGLECGDDHYIDDTIKFLKQREEENEPIHVIWYVINSASARFTAFEKRLLQDVMNNIPVLFLLNKCDIAEQHQIDALEALLNNLDLPNRIGLFQTIAKDAAMRTISVCPQCGSTDLSVRPKRKRAKCDDCEFVIDLSAPSGMEAVIVHTAGILPSLVRESFVMAQSVSFTLKDKQAKEMILTSWAAFFATHPQDRNSVFLWNFLSALISRLSVCWGYTHHGQICGLQLVDDIRRGFVFREKLYSLVNNCINMEGLSTVGEQDDYSNFTQPLALFALVILWNRCLRSLAVKLFKDTVRDVSEEEEERKFSNLMEQNFSSLSIECLTEMQVLLETDDIETILEREMPS